MLSIVYRVSIPAPATHLVHLTLSVTSAIPGASLPESLVLSMPVWTPGSYLLREYSRHVEGFKAHGPARARKVRKNAWHVETNGAERLLVTYRVYAAELTVRTSHVDDDHAFLVTAALMAAVEGHESDGADVEIDLPPGWRVFTPLPPAARPTEGSVVAFRAPDYDTLVDSPFELGAFQEEHFDALGTPHRFAICPPGAVAGPDLRRFVADTKAIVETEARLFGSALPYPRYDVVLHLAQRGRGGLEHRTSAALVAGTASFASRDAYLDLLSLVAHELFHAWNVKRIRPAGLTPYRYEGENYTRLLWWFEGGTSYYDWRVLCLSQLCTVDEYLEHLAAEIGYLDQTPGRLVQSLEDASYDAWIKLYRPDENSANSSVSYYRKGEVVCAMLDLELRARTQGRASLDEVLAHLWERYGKPERPVPEDAMQSIVEEVAKAPVGDLFDTWIRNPYDIDFAATLSHVGLAIERTQRNDGPPCSLGLKTRADGGRVWVSSVLRDGPAWRQGIDAGDEILAVGGTRVEGPHLDAALRGRAPGEAVDVVVSRDARILTKRLTLDPPRPDRVKIVPARDASPQAREAFAAWLKKAHPAERPKSTP
jgi:predicted metalloprotease with PDZ domain